MGLGSNQKASYFKLNYSLVGLEVSLQKKNYP